MRSFNTPEYSAWRAGVLRRDKYRCQMPGCNVKNKKYLQVHHIRKWSTAPYLRYDKDNGISLCVVHHKQVNRNEHHFVHLFDTIVSENKKK